MKDASRILAQPIALYHCPSCDKVLVHLTPDAPVVHVAADDHRLNGERLETVLINHRPIWA